MKRLSIFIFSILNLSSYITYSQVSDAYSEIGLTVGTSYYIGDLNDQDRISNDAAMSAVFVWLLCERAADIAGEERLLDLAEALVYAMLDQSDTTFEARDQLAAMLETASRHI